MEEWSFKKNEPCECGCTSFSIQEGHLTDGYRVEVWLIGKCTKCEKINKLVEKFSYRTSKKSAIL